MLVTTMFSILPMTNFNFSVTFIFSSVNTFNSDQSKILSVGKDFYPLSFGKGFHCLVRGLIR